MMKPFVSSLSKRSNPWKTDMKTILLTLFCLSFVRTSLAGITVFAAASTTDAMVELSELFKEQGGETVRFNFGSSGALARQIQAGAPADLFLSANEKWMDALDDADLIIDSTRVNLLKNRLVLVVPKGRACTLDKTFAGRLAVGDVRSVPAGMYAKQALEKMELFDALLPNMVMASNVRGALFFVERGEVSAGIVYATDARISKKVDLSFVFPEESHSPIRYPAAVCVNAGTPETARVFLEFLKSPDAKTVFKRYGFEP